MEFVTGSLVAAMPEKVSAFGRERPYKTCSGAKLALKKDKVKHAHLGEVALLQAFTLIKEAFDGWILKAYRPWPRLPIPVSTTWPVAKAAI